MMDVDDDFTECCICTEFFVDPRVLPCVHSFCLNCLQLTATSGQLGPGQAMSCPLCRRQFVIPAEGLTGLKRNLFVEKLVDMAKISRSLDKPVSCEKCAQDDGEEGAGELAVLPSAVQYCVQCRQSICSGCCREHRKYEELKRHQLVQLGLQMGEDDARNFVACRCDQHNKPLEMYCLECGRAICLVCFAESHQLHRCSGIEKIASRFRQQMSAHVGRMEFYAEETSRKLKVLSKQDDDFKERIENTVSAIEARGRHLKALVDEITLSLLAEVDVVKGNWKKHVAAELEEAERHQLAINKFKAYCTVLNSKGSASEICRDVGNLHFEAGEFKMKHEMRMQEGFSFSKFAFVEAQPSDISVKEKLFGRIEEKSVSFEESEWRLTQSLNVSLGQPKELEIGKCQLTGLTTLEGTIYVLSASPKTIFAINDQEPFSTERRFEINEIRKPCDMAAIAQPKCLYVTDKDNRCVWQITLRDSAVRRWLDGVCEPFSISTSSEGNHLLILNRLHPVSRIDIYRTADANLVRTITLPESILNPVFAIQSAAGQLFIVHQHHVPGGGGGGGGSGGCCVLSHVSGDGQVVIESFNQKERLKLPCHLAFDPDSLRLFVPDLKGDTVFLFDSLSLRRNRVILTKENSIDNPVRVCYDPQKRRVIVGNWVGKLSMFSVN